MHGKAPPLDAGTWPFAVLLQYCMDNGLGSKPPDTKWTAKTLAGAAQGSGGFAVKTVEAWRQGQNVPRSENWPTLLRLLLAAEPDRYRKAWQRRLDEARDIAEAQTRQRYLETVRNFKRQATERDGASRSFREMMRQVAKNEEDRENRVLQELDAAKQAIEGQLGNLAPLAARKAREAEEARQAGEYDEAELRLGEAEAALAEPARDAQALTSALAAIHAQQGRLQHDRELFEEAASRFLDALRFAPFADTENRSRYAVLLWRSTNLALIGSKDFAAASTLMEQPKLLGLKPNVVTSSIWMHKARDYDQAAGVLDQMLAAGVAPNEVTFSTLMAKARDYDQAKGVLDQMLAAGVAPNEVTFNTLMAKARDYDQAAGVLDQMLAAGVAPKNWTIRNAMAMARDYDQAAGVLDQIIAANIAPEVRTFTKWMAKATDYDQAAGVLDQMLAAGVAPNEVTATTFATFMGTLAEATWATQLLNPHRATGPAYFNKVLAQLAPRHEATELLGWAFSTARGLGFRFPVGSFDGAIRTYQKIGRVADAVRVAWAFPHLDGSRKLLAEEGPACGAILLARFEAGDDEQRHVSYALAVLHEVNGDAGKARRWAEVSLGYDQPPQRVDDLRRLIAGKPRQSGAETPKQTPIANK